MRLSRLNLLWLLTLAVLLSACGTDGGEFFDADDDTVESFADGDSAETDGLCTPGRWTCRDDNSTWRCRADGQAYDEYTICPERHLCYEGTCYPIDQGDDDRPSDESEIETDGDVIPDADSDEPLVTDGDGIDETDGDEPSDGDKDVSDFPDPDGDDEPDLEPEPEREPDPEPEAEFEWEVDDASYIDHCDGLQNSALWNCLQNYMEDHRSLGYGDAKDAMFNDIDNQGGRVQCVYTGEWVTTDGVPPTSIMNTEHSWPQSYGADVEPARSDLFHLYPALADVNSRRSNVPFGEVATATWSEGGSKKGKDALGRTVFEPRDPHKGDVVRALFYFAIHYEGGYSQTPWYDEDVLRQWNRDDPPSAWERSRNEAIENYQDRRNPFVDRPDFIDAIDDFTRSYRLVAPPPPMEDE
ncbi:MAG: hypothetical protein C4523_13890 [Myxococcales bacterium]|nr:MAG: hypothetical protein C4523_13890 [Myxococcales bacterium]